METVHEESVGMDQRLREHLEWCDRRYDALKEEIQAMRKKLFHLEHVIEGDHDPESQSLVREVVDETQRELRRLIHEAARINTAIYEKKLRDKGVHRPPPTS